MAVVSSCREMLGSVPQRAQPLPLVSLSSGTAAINAEEGGDDVKSARPLRPWATHTLQWSVQRAANPRGGANPNKTGLSSDCRLKPACMKEELLVTVGQHTTVNTFPGLVHTARHTTKVGNT